MYWPSPARCLINLHLMSTLEGGGGDFTLLVLGGCCIGTVPGAEGPSPAAYQTSIRCEADYAQLRSLSTPAAAAGGRRAIDTLLRTPSRTFRHNSPYYHRESLLTKLLPPPLLPVRLPATLLRARTIHIERATSATSDTHLPYP